MICITDIATKYPQISKGREPAQWWRLPTTRRVAEYVKTTYDLTDAQVRHTSRGNGSKTYVHPILARWYIMYLKGERNPFKCLC